MSVTARQFLRLMPGKGVNCPVCGHDHGCALFDPPIACICLRVSDGCAKRRDGTEITAKGGMGWLHRLNGKKVDIKHGSLASPSEKLTIPQLKSLLKQHRQDLTNKLLSSAAETLHATEKSLVAYGIGWDRRSGCWSFPMYDGKQRPCGIRLRNENGKIKRCVVGSRNGLFIPNDYAPSEVPLGDDPCPYLLLLPEGPTSAASARDLGFIAIGRPSNNGGIIELPQLLRPPSPPQDVCIVADRDGARWLPNGRPFFPGFEGALAVAESVLPHCGRLRFFQTPKGTKDLREWVSQNGTAGMLKNMLIEADVVTPEWLVAKRELVSEWRTRLKRRKAS